MDDMLSKIAEAIRAMPEDQVKAELTTLAMKLARRKPEDVVKTYIVAYSEYMYTKPYMYRFSGTWRELLEYLNNITEENRDQIVDRMTNNDLVNHFNQANGDGQPFYQVWCVEDETQVLGQGE